MVIILYPAIVREASPMPSKALRTKDIPANQVLMNLNIDFLLILNCGEKPQTEGGTHNQYESD